MSAFPLPPCIRENPTKNRTIPFAHAANRTDARAVQGSWLWILLNRAHSPVSCLPAFRIIFGGVPLWLRQCSFGDSARSVVSSQEPVELLRPVFKQETRKP